MPEIQIEKLGRLIRTVDDWRAYAPPKSENHWCEGRSALECARAWCGDGKRPAVPSEIIALLESNADTAGFTVTTAIPEHPVAFDDLVGEPRNTDLAVLAQGPRGTLAVSIEAKADESFGEYIGDMLADAVDRIAHGEDTGAVKRITGLISLLPQRPKRNPKAGKLRYQLLTALGGALAFAHENNAVPVLVIHEFETALTTLKLRQRNQLDLDRFVARISAGECRRLTAGIMLGPFSVKEPGRPFPSSLYIGKAARIVGKRS